VAPEATEGAESDVFQKHGPLTSNPVRPPPPSGCACHLSLAGEDQVGLDKPAHIMYARCVHWLRPKDKTGAKLVSMHETVTSPTEYRSRHEA